MVIEFTMSFDYSLIYLFIGFLGGVAVSIFIGVITYSTAFVVVVSSSIGVILSASVSKIISDEVKRKRDHTEKMRENKEEKMRNHIVRQILPLLDDWSDLKIYNSNVWQNMTILINRDSFDYFKNKDYFTESKSHLENYPIIWEEWKKVNKLIESVNKDGNIIINSLKINLEEKLNNKFLELTAVKNGDNIDDNQYLIEGILQRIIYRRIYELLNNITDDQNILSKLKELE